MNDVTAGEVKITLGTEEVTLRPTLEAALSCNRYFGNLQAAATRVASLDFEATVFVVNAALGKSGKSANATSKLVFEAGLQNLLTPLIKFIGMLSNGGKEVNAPEDDEGN
jgi:hypothetical protein